MNPATWPKRPQTIHTSTREAREWINDTRRVLGISVTKLSEGSGVGRVTMSNFINQDLDIKGALVDKTLTWLDDQLKERGDS